MKIYKPAIIWEPYKFDFQAKKQKQDDESDVVWDDDDDEDIVLNKNLIYTPFGIFDVDDSMNPFKRFEFWMGHTNFNITKEVATTIKRCPGVEVLFVNTRYRFIIGIGKMFQFRDVRVELEFILCGKHAVATKLDLIVNQEIKDSATKLIHQLSQENPCWILYIMPNGTVCSKGTTQRDVAFMTELQFYTAAQELSEGLLITSEDENERN